MPFLIISCLFLLSFWTYSHLILPHKAKKHFKDAPIRQFSPSKYDLYKRGALFTGYSTLFSLSFGLASRITILGSISLTPKTMFLAVAVVVMVICLEPIEWKVTSKNYKQRLLNLAPQTQRERMIWILIVLIPAIGEEIIYRAVFFGLFYKLFGSFWIAALISSTLFAISHKTYGPPALASSFLMGFVLQYFVRISGGLFLSIAIHYIVDVINGIIIGSRESDFLISECRLTKDEGTIQTDVS